MEASIFYFLFFLFLKASPRERLEHRVPERQLFNTMINFKMYQDNRKNSKKKGYWYARVCNQGIADIKYLAGRISNTCTVTESDILAVISALVTEMGYALKDGKRVVLSGLGSFKAGFRSKGVEK